MCSDFPLQCTSNYSTHSDLYMVREPKNDAKQILGNICITLRDDRGRCMLSSEIGTERYRRIKKNDWERTCNAQINEMQEGNLNEESLLVEESWFGWDNFFPSHNSSLVVLTIEKAPDFSINSEIAFY